MTASYLVRVNYRAVAEFYPILHFGGRNSNLQYSSQILLLYFKKVAKGHFFEEKKITFCCLKVALSHLFEDLKQYLAIILQIWNFSQQSAKTSKIQPSLCN